MFNGIFARRQKCTSAWHTVFSCIARAKETQACVCDTFDTFCVCNGLFASNNAISLCIVVLTVLFFSASLPVWLFGGVLTTETLFTLTTWPLQRRHAHFHWIWRRTKKPKCHFFTKVNGMPFYFVCNGDIHTTSIL